jgi:hypothetical protein
VKGPALPVERALAVGALAALAVVIAVVPHQAMHLYEKQVRSAAAENAYWTVSGPPCAPISRQAFESLGFRREIHGFNFQDVNFAYAFGDTECRKYGDRRSSYQRCMFTSPGAIRVRLSGSDTFYEPGTGQPATVSIVDGKLSCVLASHFTAINPSFGQDEATWDKTHPVNHGDADLGVRGLVE